jgi:hypothetical protein
MIPANEASGTPDAGTKQVFTDAFIRNAHRILHAGYERLDAAAYHASEEDEITGDLAFEMNEVIGNSPEPWMRMYQVHDQHPVTPPGGPKTVRRVGKRRSKIDLQFVANSGSGFHRFSWEAKRLGPGHAIGDYLGHAGMGCFLSGQYSSDCDFGGMLGYAQSEDELSWLSILIGKLGRTSLIPLKQAIPHAPLKSIHARPLVDRSIAIWHTILRFN